MPPVRWKPSLAVSVLFLLWMRQTTAVKMEKFSMSDDGWRPIIGSQYKESSVHEEITHYRNPASKKSEAVKAEKPNKMAIHDVTSRPQATTASNNNLVPLGLGSKIPPHSKPMMMMQSHGAHGPQIPLGPMMHRPVKYGHVVKMHPMKRHKPIRMQIPAYSTRDEIFVPAPSSNLGPYSFYTPGPAPIKTRVNQHIDYTNHFALQNQHDDIYQVLRSPIQQYVLPKHPIQNDVHYSFQGQDDFNRNLVPPPFKYVQEPEKKVLKPFKENVEHVAPKPPNNNGVIVQVNPPVHQYSTFNPNVQKKKEQGVDIQVTKERFKVYQSTTPSFSQLDQFEYHTIKQQQKQQQQQQQQQQQPHKLVTYEVTEGKWQETPPFTFHYSNPVKSRRPVVPVFTEDSKPFLPTPIKPDTVPPTVPTESEVSTIYNQIAKLNRQREQERVTPTSFFDIKEVSTHFPVVGPPEYQEYPTRFSFEAPKEEINEITTKNIREKPSFFSEEIEADTTTTTQRPTTTPAPTRPMRKRPSQRRRRPTQKTTTTEEPEVTDAYETQKTDASVEEITERHIRGRRPMRYRTTTPTYIEEEYTTRTRHRRPRPTTEKIPENQNTTFEEPTVETYIPRDERIILRPTTEKDFPANFESQFHKTSESSEETDKVEYERPNRFYNTPPNREDKKRLEDSGEMESPTPENEIDYPVVSSVQPTTIKIETTVPTETTTAPTTTTTTTIPSTTTSTTTTTTPAPTTTELSTPRSHRIRTRPVKYDNSNRPRFSVKEYRQRLTTSTTSTTTAEPPKSSTYPENMRNRFPHRSRRPITTIGHTEPEEQTEPIRGKFIPKDPRHSNIEGNTEQPVKVNTRLRPFGRFKATTEPSSTTQRISIKPNIFSNLRRPTPISLKSRIMHKHRSTTAKPETTTPEDDSLEETNETDMSEIVESTVPYQEDSTTEFGAKVTLDVVDTKPKKPETDILKNEDFMQSQIVSDLTSSSKNEYNKPGVFKNVSPTSRKVPSYFTLATDDPILPIEAFFPNLKQ